MSLNPATRAVLPDGAGAHCRTLGATR